MNFLSSRILTGETPENYLSCRHISIFIISRQIGNADPETMIQLASGFQKAILVDADTIFLQRPDSYFNDDIHLKETGTLFYHDRAVKGGYTGFVLFGETCFI